MKIFFTSAVCLIVISVICFFAAPQYIESKVKSALQENCPQCQLEIDSISIGPLLNKVSIHEIQFSGDPKDTTFVKVNCEEINVRFILGSIFKKPIKIEKLELDKLTVNIIEKYIPETKKPNPKELIVLKKTYGGKPLEFLPPLLVKTLEIKESALHYTLNTHDKNAKLKVHKISASIENIKTREEIGPRYTTVRLTGEFQNSGEVILKLNADLFTVENKDVLDIEVKNLKMNELDSFFIVESGIEMQGFLKTIHAQVKLENGHMTGTLRTAYNNLKLQLKPTPDRGGFVTLLQDIFQKVKFAETKPAMGKSSPYGKVDYKRLPEQGIIKFILNGLKEAAFKAASN